MSFRSRIDKQLWATALLCMALVSAQGAVSPEPTWFRASRVERAPLVDGRLDDAAWAQAQKVTGFAVLGTGKPARVQTLVRAVADDVALYIAVQCDEPRIGQLVFKERPLDDKVWEDDSVEVFLDPDNSKTKIYHLIVNASGSRYDGVVTGGEVATGRDLNDDEAWSGDWSAACWRGSRGWNAEIKVPFETLGINGKHSTLVGVNIMRSRQAGERELSSWMPCKTTFLEPMASGELYLRGADGSLVIMDCPRIGTQIVGKRELAIKAINDGGSPLQLSLYRDLSNGHPFTTALTVAMPVIPYGHRAQTIPLDLKTPGEHHLIIRMSDTERRIAGTVHRVFNVVRPVEITEKLYAMFYRRIEAEVSAQLPDVPGTETSLRVALIRDGGAKALAVKVMGAQAGPALVKFDASNVPSGRYQIKASVMRGGKAEFTSFSRVYPYDPNPKVGFNGDGFLTVAGKPFFPIGMYTIQDKGGKEHVRLQKEAVRAGFNTTVFYAYTNDALLPLLDAAERSGLKAFVYPTIPVSVRKGGETRDQFISDVKARMNHPALLGWYIVDEPEGIGKASADVARDLYQLVRETDPKHPCSMVTMSPTAAGLYRDGADVMWVDPYPIPHARADTVGKVTAGAVNAVEKDKPVWVIPQAFDWSIWRSGKFAEQGVHRPTDVEERCMTYLALVNGAKGIIYWAFLGSRYSILDYPEHWAYMKKLAGEMRVLSPVLLTPNVEGALKVSPGGERRPTTALEALTMRPAAPPVETMVKKLNGQNYVFAVNRSPKACSAWFTLSNTAKAAKAEVLFDKRAVSLVDGYWFDEFMPLEVHVYRLAGG